MSDQPSSPWRALSMFGAIGLQLAVWIVAGLYAGRWLDRLLATEPLFLVIGVLGGVAIGFLSMVYLIKRYLGEGS